MGWEFEYCCSSRIVYNAQKMKFSMKDFFSKCDQIRSADLVTFTEEILHGKLHFLCSVNFESRQLMICESVFLNGFQQVPDSDLLAFTEKLDNKL